MPFKKIGLDPQDVVTQVALEVLSRSWSAAEAAKAFYIPQLAEEPDGFGIGVLVFDPDTYCKVGVTPRYKIYTAGDATLRRTIQSGGKVPMATLAVQLDRSNAIWTYAGERATHAPFNDVQHLLEGDGRPWHPFGNAGAIRVVARLFEADPDLDPRALWLRFVRKHGGNQGIDIDASVAESEQLTCDVNRAAGLLMRSRKKFPPGVDAAVNLYCEFCATRLDIADMLRLYAYLANDGIGLDGNPVLPVRYALELREVLRSTGAYEETVQLMRQLVPLKPLAIKTAVSGYIVLVCEGMVVVVCDPRKNDAGNSVPGIYALRRLAERFAQAKGW